MLKLQNIYTLIENPKGDTCICSFYNLYTSTTWFYNRRSRVRLQILLQRRPLLVGVGTSFFFPPPPMCVIYYTTIYTTFTIPDAVTSASLHTNTRSIGKQMKAGNNKLTFFFFQSSKNRFSTMCLFTFGFLSKRRGSEMLVNKALHILTKAVFLGGAWLKLLSFTLILFFPVSFVVSAVTLKPRSVADVPLVVAVNNMLMHRVEGQDDEDLFKKRRQTRISGVACKKLATMRQYVNVRSVDGAEDGRSVSSVLQANDSNKLILPPACEERSSSSNNKPGFMISFFVIFLQKV